VGNRVEDHVGHGDRKAGERSRIKIGAGGSSKLFKIKKAYFKPGQQAEWIQVLEDAHPQEFYVPYYFRGTVSSICATSVATSRSRRRKGAPSVS